MKIQSKANEISQCIMRYNSKLISYDECGSTIGRILAAPYQPYQYGIEHTEEIQLLLNLAQTKAIKQTDAAVQIATLERMSMPQGAATYQANQMPPVASICPAVPIKKPITKRPWFWGIVAIAVIVITVITVISLQESANNRLREDITSAISGSSDITTEWEEFNYHGLTIEVDGEWQFAESEESDNDQTFFYLNEDFGEMLPAIMLVTVTAETTGSAPENSESNLRYITEGFVQGMSEGANIISEDMVTINGVGGILFVAEGEFGGFPDVRLETFATLYEDSIIIITNIVEIKDSGSYEDSIIHVFESIKLSDGGSNPIVTESESPIPDESEAVDPIVMFEQNGIKISYVGFDEYAFMGPEFKLHIENNSDVPITVQARDSSIDGVMVDGVMSCDVLPGKVANTSLTFWSSTLERNGIETIGSVDLKFHIFHADTWDTIVDTNTITLQAQ